MRRRRFTATRSGTYRRKPGAPRRPRFIKMGSARRSPRAPLLLLPCDPPTLRSLGLFAAFVRALRGEFDFRLLRAAPVDDEHVPDGLRDVALRRGGDFRPCRVPIHGALLAEA